MKVAVMQPYFFPYIGYYQLVASVDEFVFFDDVTYIKKGHINRNSILLNRNQFDFTIPISKVSQNKKILDHYYSGEFESFFRKITYSYKKAPWFLKVIPIIERVIFDSNNCVAEKNAKSIQMVCEYIGLNRAYSFSSALRIDEKFKAQDRVIEICKRKKSSEYHNASGGINLYRSEDFKKDGIELKFVKTKSMVYSQGDRDFVPNLSIIDVLMWNDLATVRSLLQEYVLV